MSDRTWDVTVSSRLGYWEPVVVDVDEDTARKAFTNIEVECAINKRGYTEIKLSHECQTQLHVRWNR